MYYLAFPMIGYVNIVHVKLELDNLIYKIPYSIQPIIIILQRLQDREGNSIRAWYDSIATQMWRAVPV